MTVHAYDDECGEHRHQQEWDVEVESGHDGGPCFLRGSVEVFSGNASSPVPVCEEGERRSENDQHDDRQGHGADARFPFGKVRLLLQGKAHGEEALEADENENPVGVGAEEVGRVPRVADGDVGFPVGRQLVVGELDKQSEGVGDSEEGHVESGRGHGHGQHRYQTSRVARQPNGHQHPDVDGA